MRRAAAEQKADDEAMILGKAQKVVDLVTEGLSALAQADLSRHFENPLDPEYDAIRTDFNAATQRLRDVMLTISETALDLDRSAGDLMQSSSDLGMRTTEQVETIASANERVSKLSNEVADFATNVRDASERASTAKDRADQSGTVVRSAVDAMGRIAASSQDDWPDHHDHRGHHLSDQSARTQCRCRSGARGRKRPWICGGCVRGA